LCTERSAASVVMRRLASAVAMGAFMQGIPGIRR
jgi:hypothetical protein